MEDATLVFVPNSPVGHIECIDIEIVDDEGVESSPEQFNIELQSNDPVRFMENTGSVFIHDDDCKHRGLFNDHHPQLFKFSYLQYLQLLL